MYCVKHDGRLKKNSDLTPNGEKPTNKETLASSTDLLVPNGEHTTINVPKHESSSAGGQDSVKVADFEQKQEHQFYQKVKEQGGEAKGKF